MIDIFSISIVFIVVSGLVGRIGIGMLHQEKTISRTEI